MKDVFYRCGLRGLPDCGMLAVFLHAHAAAAGQDGTRFEHRITGTVGDPMGISPRVSRSIGGAASVQLTITKLAADFADGW
jgi:hypothetical protein